MNKYYPEIKIEPELQVKGKDHGYSGSGKFQVELLDGSKPPVLIFDKEKEGRLNTFNIAGVIKKIRDAEE